MDNELKQAKRDYAWSMAAIGAVFTASSVISLIQHGFHVRLNWGFEHFVAFYRDIITPVMDVVLSPVRASLMWLHIDWTIPQWAMDIWALSFLGIGVSLRAMALHMSALQPLKHSPFMPRITFFVRFRVPIFLRLAAFATFFGFSGLGLILWFSPWIRSRVLIPWGITELAIMHQIVDHPDARVQLDWAERAAAAVDEYEEQLRPVIGKLILMSVLATVAFYIGNSIMPQLGLH